MLGQGSDHCGDGPVLKAGRRLDVRRKVLDDRTDVGILLAGTAELATGHGQAFRTLTPSLFTAVAVLFALGLVRAVALLRRGTGASWREAAGALLIWQSTSLVVARASVLGLFARKAAFLRTPKTSQRAKWWQPLRAKLGRNRAGPARRSRHRRGADQNHH